MTKTPTKRPRRTLLLAATAVIATALATASPAMAEPKGIFKVYNDCPTEIPGLALCQVATTTGGEFAIGSTKVPINKTITLQGGAIHTGINRNEYFLLPAKDGNSLSKTELNVPGGLTDFVKCEEIKGEFLFEKLARAACKLAFESGPLEVTATTELVASEKDPAILNLTHLVFEEQTALVLPVRLHLKNTFLGSSCYIGSETNPVQLNLTTGTTAPPLPNKPIKGKLGTINEEVEKGFEATTITENSLVDNSFSAPKAEGCGGFFSGIIDPILDTKIGLPSTSGNNTAILNGTLKTAETEAVLASEKF
jgi:hypothetical protein